jgi:ABC-type multidrug transport system fused ATPase/permease subunit
MSAGSLVSFMLYQQSLSSAFNMMGDVFSALTAAVGAADKVRAAAAAQRTRGVSARGACAHRGRLRFAPRGVPGVARHAQLAPTHTHLSCTQTRTHTRTTATATPPRHAACRS